MRHFSAGEGLCPPRRSNIAHLILAVRLLVRDWLLSWDLQRGRREKETKRSAHGEDPGEQTDVEQGRAEIARAGAEDARYGFRPQPIPHPPVAGMACDCARPFPAPTMPGVDNSFARLALRQPGHSGVRSAVTNASNVRPQSPHRYSYMGMNPL